MPPSRLHAPCDRRKGLESDTKWGSDTNDIAGIEFSLLTLDLLLLFFSFFSQNLCFYFFLPLLLSPQRLRSNPSLCCPAINARALGECLLSFRRPFLLFLFFSFSSADPHLK